jgi:hypothetical protein
MENQVKGLAMFLNHSIFFTPELISHLSPDSRAQSISWNQQIQTDILKKNWNKTKTCFDRDEKIILTIVVQGDRIDKQSTSSFNTLKDVIIPGKLIASYPLQYPGKAQGFSPFLWQSASFWPTSLGVHRASKAGCNSSNLESSSLKRYVPHLWCSGESSLHFLVRLRTAQDLSLCSLAVNWHVTSLKIILLTMLGLSNSI